MATDRLSGQEIKGILQLSKTGSWALEFKEGERPCLYADEVMNELLGTQESMTPKERFFFHREHVHEDDMDLFQEYTDKLEEERVEIVYRYIHPIRGEMYVRCGGKKDESVTEYHRYIGYHQDISDTVRLEKDKQAEQRLAEMNLTLRKEHMIQQNYYKDLLDVQSCGLMAIS